VALDAIDLRLPGARVRFTGRAGGVSEGAYASLNLGRWTDDDPAAVAENRRRAADGAPIAFARQVHGTRVIALDEAPGDDGAIEEADGVVTRAPGVAALVLTADCVPVALAAPDAVAMVHAGWKGLSGGVLEAGVAALAATGPVHAAIGPAAGACCYEVGPEVAERFPAWALDGRRLDLKAVAAALLRAAGVAEVLDVGRCTMCEPDVFFSHRASGPVTGRQGGIAWRS
jgi:polyphenol oxidase